MQQPRTGPKKKKGEAEEAPKTWADSALKVFEQFCLCSTFLFSLLPQNLNCSGSVLHLCLLECFFVSSLRFASRVILSSFVIFRPLCWLSDPVCLLPPVWLLLHRAVGAGDDFGSHLRIDREE